MKKKCILTALNLMIAVLLVSCGKEDSKFPGYCKTNDGLYYRFYYQNESGELPGKTDFMKMSVLCYLNDTLYYDFNEGDGVVHAQLTESRFKGDLQSAFSMMKVGDSASFYIKADSLASVYYSQDPSALGLSSEDYFRYEIKMLEIKNQEDFQNEIQQMKQDMETASRDALAAYISENSIDVIPTESGIYVIPLKKSKGRCPQKGEKVEVNYDVYLLDGTLVGSSKNQSGKFSFVLGEGYVIPGWEEIMPMIHVGEKVRAIIPFEMAYGEHNMGSVKPYSNLVYDIELLNITTAEEMSRIAELQMKQLKVKSENDFAQYVKENGFSNKTESGLCYRFRKENNGMPPAVGSVARVKFKASVMNGAELGTSDSFGDYYDIQYGKRNVLPGLEEGIGLMTVGDIADFAIPYTLAYGENPYGTIPAYSNLIFEVEMLDILSFDEANQSSIEKANADFEQYLKDNKIKEKKRESGLVYVRTKKGSGECAVAGQTVTVHYTGKFLDGRVFDSSVERGEPISFVLGEGRVIKGWEEGIALMKKGEKATLILPYTLAYGNRQTGEIPPYSTLVFDVEIIDIQ